MFKLYCKVTSLWVKNNLVRLLGSTIVLFKNCLGQLGQQQSCDRLNGSTIVTFQNCLGQQYSVPALFGSTTVCYRFVRVKNSLLQICLGQQMSCYTFVWDNNSLVWVNNNLVTALHGPTTIVLQSYMVNNSLVTSLFGSGRVLFLVCVTFYFWCVLATVLLHPCLD